MSLRFYPSVCHLAPNAWQRRSRDSINQAPSREEPVTGAAAAFCFATEEQPSLGP